MNRTVTIASTGSERHVDETDFPLSVGGAGSDITLPRVDGPGAMAWIGLADGEIFLQAGDGSASCNGIPVATSQWLRGGDVVRIAGGCVRVEIDAERLRLIVEPDDAENEAVPQASVIATGRGVELAPAPAGVLIRPIEFKPSLRASGTPRRLRPRPATLLAVTAVVLLAAAAWSLYTVRPVELRIDPEPDSVEIRGSLIDWVVGGRHVLRAGSYTLVAEKAGYRTLETPLIVTREAVQSLEFRLEKLPGLLALSTGDVSGARVEIDGQSVGTTPLEPIELPPGEHDVRVVADRHADYVGRVVIEGEGRTQILEVALVPRWAPVRLTSEPSGASVSVDGRTVGVTPLVADLGEGRHDLHWSLAGYKPERAVIVVTANVPQDAPTAQLEPADATLRVTSDPSGATVSVDGRFEAETPAEIYLEPGRPHEVMLTRAGHEPATRQVSVAAGETAELDVRLVPRLGTVELAVWPPDAEVLVDGQSLPNAASRVLQLEAVPHAIEVRKPGYESHTANVTPTPGLPQSLRVVLQTPEQAFAERTPRSIRTVQGQELLLIEGGKFLMGAPRREPGRRSNEVEREVEITRPYYLATMEVSNRHYREFEKQHLSGRVGDFSLEMDHHPVVRVSWEQAAAYCNWLSEREGRQPAYVAGPGGRLVAAAPLTTGYRLPTEAEWSWAARHGGGREPRKYPWGETLPIASSSGNYADASALSLLTTVMGDYDDEYPVTAPVDAFRPNVLGILNLGGNVAEWMHDHYAINPDVEGLDLDPTGPVSGEHHVIRGSSWMTATVTELRLSYRDSGNKERPDVGFRIARYAE